MILSHAGGFLPYAAHRIANLIGANDLVTSDSRLDQEKVLASLGTFGFDTALSGSPTALPSLLAFARPGTWCSAPTGPSPPAKGSATSPAGSTPSPASTRPDTRRSTAATPRLCSHGWPADPKENR